MRKNSKITGFILWLLVGSQPFVFAQTPQFTSTEGTILAVHLSYGYHFPGGDLQARFGSNFSIGTGLQLILPSNWVLGAESQFLFGQQVKTDVLATLRSPEGYIFGLDGGTAEILLRERGFWFGANLGKLIPLVPGNPRSGLRLSLGAGLLQHKIRIQDDPLVSVPALSGEYKKGYDRLSNGLALQEFIGYQHFSINRRINFFIGLELTQGFTASRRDWNTDQMAREEGARFDLLYGIRAGWALPFYVGEGSGGTIYY